MLRKSFASASERHAKLLLRRSPLPSVASATFNALIRPCPSPVVALGPLAGVRSFSDRQSERLLGHSPMAPASSSQEEKGARIPTQEDVSIAGGVWNPTSAKRDKLAELRTELSEHQFHLDDAATPEQKLDLYLADGIQWIVHTADQIRLQQPNHRTSLAVTEEEDEAAAAVVDLPKEMDPKKWDMEETLVEVENWIKQQEQNIHTTIADGNLNQEQWETYLSELTKKLDEVLPSLPSSRYLRDVRDFYVVPPDNMDELLSTTTSTTTSTLKDDLVATDDQTKVASAGAKALARYRLLLTRAASEHMKDSWEKWTTLSDEALDRLAVKTDGEEVEGAVKTLPLHKLNAVLRSHLVGNCSDRVDALWDLMDYDNDGLLEKSEMETVAHSAVTPVQSAILALFEEALEAHPVRVTPKTDGDGDTTQKKKGSAPVQQLGWRQRRREKKEKKRLLKMFQQAVKNHFEDEVEMPHRLRCIYTWADKAHQDNKLDSVLIEASGWSGRKRYVELQPKIALPEFREVQQVHFTHLDRIGWEIMKSYREDLWVHQGKGRQNAELKRDCVIFLTVVGVLDYAIIVF